MKLLPPIESQDTMLSSLAYPLGFFVSPYLLLSKKKEDSFVRFHAIQGLALNITITVIILVGLFFLFLMARTSLPPNFVDNLKENDPNPLNNIYMNNGCIVMAIWVFYFLFAFVLFLIEILCASRVWTGEDIRLPVIGEIIEKKLFSDIVAIEQEAERTGGKVEPPPKKPSVDDLPTARHDIPFTKSTTPAVPEKQPNIQSLLNQSNSLTKTTTPAVPEKQSSDIQSLLNKSNSLTKTTPVVPEKQPDIQSLLNQSNSFTTKTTAPVVPEKQPDIQSLLGKSNSFTTKTTAPVVSEKEPNVQSSLNLSNPFAKSTTSVVLEKESNVQSSLDQSNSFAKSTKPVVSEKEPRIQSSLSQLNIQKAPDDFMLDAISYAKKQQALYNQKQTQQTAQPNVNYDPSITQEKTRALYNEQERYRENGQTNQSSSRTYADGTFSSGRTRTYADGTSSADKTRAYSDATFSTGRTRTYADGTSSTGRTNNYSDANSSVGRTRTYADGTSSTGRTNSYTDGYSKRIKL